MRIPHEGKPLLTCHVVSMGTNVWPFKTKTWRIN